MKKEKNKPTELQKLGRVRTKIWANKAEDGTLRYSVDVFRTYKDKSGFRDTSSFGEEDLPLVQIAYQNAQEFIAQQKEPSS